MVEEITNHWMNPVIFPIKKTIGRMSFSSSFQLSTLLATTAAAKQHSFRAYLTVQEWIGLSLPPT